MNRLWTETDAAIVSSELVLVSAIMVCGLVTALTRLRDAMVDQIEGFAQTISSLDQSGEETCRPDEIAMQRWACTQVVGSVVQE